MSAEKTFTNATGAPVADNTNIMTAGRRGPALLQDIWLIEKIAQFDRVAKLARATGLRNPVGEAAE
jgi:catalase